jgi:hypothetical protein
VWPRRPTQSGLVHAQGCRQDTSDQRQAAIPDNLDTRHRTDHRSRQYRAQRARAVCVHHGWRTQRCQGIASLPVVIGRGFGLDPSTLAEIMLASTSRNALPGLECVGPLKVTDTVATTRLNISSGSLPLPSGPGLGINLDDNNFDSTPWDSGSCTV